MNAILQDQPLPARLLPWPKATLTSLQRCLMLALLLHLWLVLWLGNAPGGTAPAGQGVFGAINITLRGPVTEGAPVVVVPPAPANDTAGPADTPRWGGVVRQSEPAPDSTPGAARLGPSAPLGPSGAAQPMPLPAPDAAISPTSATATATAQTVAVPVPLPTPTPAPPPVAEAAAAVAPPDRVLENRLAAPRKAAAGLASAAEPVTTAPLAPPVPHLLPAPMLATPAPAPAQRIVQATPTPINPPAPAPETLPELPVERRLQAPATALRAPQPALSPSATTAVAPTLEPGQLPRADMSAARPGAPDAGAQVGRDVATPAAAAASAVPRLNLELARPRGGELSRHGTAGVLPLLPRPPERDDKLARDIEKAARGDCRTAHSGMGILAVIPLVVDAVKKDGGCKW